MNQITKHVWPSASWWSINILPFVWVIFSSSAMKDTIESDKIWHWDLTQKDVLMKNKMCYKVFWVKAKMQKLALKSQNFL